MLISLDFLVTDPKNIIHFLKNNNFHIDTIKGFYSPIVKFIYYLPFDVSGYDWIKLRNKLHDSAKKEKNEETKLLFASHMDEHPRRSSA